MSRFGWREGDITNSPKLKTSAVYRLQQRTTICHLDSSCVIAQWKTVCKNAAPACPCRPLYTHAQARRQPLEPSDCLAL